MTMKTEAHRFLRELTLAGAVIENASGGALAIELEDKNVWILLGDDVCYLIGGVMDDRIPYNNWQIFERDVKRKLEIG